MATATAAPETAVDRVPTEFETYWRKRDLPSTRRARRAFKAIFRFDPLPSEAVVRDVAHGYYDADPVAEEFVDEVYLGRSANEGRRMLDAAIAGGVDSVPDAPESMRRLFDEFEREPEWLDRELAERGAQAFRRFGPAVFSFAGVETLLGYTESSIVKPLAFTGSYAGDTALNRFMETARFWIDVSEPGGLDPGAAGRATAMRVRVMHVFVRRRLLQHPDWDLDAWGVPISQSDALVTLLSSSLTPGIAMAKMGFWTSGGEIRAMMHFWRYVGHLLGVQPRWYPAGIREAVQFSALFMLKRSFTAGADGAELISSYPAAFVPKRGTPIRKRIRDEINYRAQLGYTRYFLPGSFYRRYEMPNPWPWALHPLLQAPGIFAVETARRFVPGAAGLQDRYARKRRETWWRNEMGDRESKFNPAEHFRR